MNNPAPSTRFRAPMLHLLLLASALMLATTVAAQAPAVPTRPEYRVTRFDESWGVIRSIEAKHPVDQLKYIPLTGSGAAYLSIGGQFRARGEAVSNFLSSGAADRTDSFGLARALLHADLRTGRYLRLFAEGKHAVAFSRDLPGGKRPLDQDEWELQNAFVDLTYPGTSAYSFTARVGRQELLVGSQRLVSPLDWSNTRRTFEGGRLIARVSAVTLDGFLTEPVVVQVNDRNSIDTNSTFWGGTARGSTPSPTFAWEVFALGLSQDSVALFGSNGEHDRVTLGGRLTGAFAGGPVRYDLEGGWQTGDLGSRNIAAWFVATDITRSFAAAPLRPTVGLGFDYASGDSDPADDKAGTFHQLFPLGYAYAGYMDLVGRQNLIEARAVATANPTAAIQTRAALHHFMRATTSDAAYNVGGGVLREDWSDDRAIGSELNLTAAYRLNRHTRLELGYGHFVPADFLTGSPAGAEDSDWGFVSTSFTF